MFWHGKVGSCLWMYHSGPTDHWDDYIATSVRLFAEGRQGDVSITIPYRSAAPSALQRKQLADFINTNRDIGKFTHHALITDSALVAGINTAVNWISKKPWVERSFTSPQAGLTWMKQMAPALDSGALALSIVETVPQEFLWPAFSVLARSRA